MTATREFGRRQLADVVVPIALAVKGQQLAYELAHYKYDRVARVRNKFTMQLAAVLWRFLEEHIAEAVNVPGFDVVTAVPGTRPRDDEHPLVRMVSSLVGETRARYETLLTLQSSEPVEAHTVLPDLYRLTRQARRIVADNPNVLLIDDTWTAGGRAQSAVLALRDGGAAKVGVVAIGRHFDRSYGAGETYYQRAKAQPFSWDLCCLDGSSVDA